MHKTLKTFIAVGGVITVAVSGFTSSLPVLGQSSTKNIVEVAKEAGTFNSLVTALEKADLVSTLQGPGPFTVFAPTDDAFAKIPSPTLNSLLNDANQKAELVKILTYHVVAGKNEASQVVNLSSAKTVEGSEVKISVRNGEVFLNDNVKVTRTDIQASNGVIHVIDTVLMPPVAQTSNSTESMTNTTSSNSLVRTGGESNVAMAVTLGAFAAMASALVLSYKKENN